MRRVKLLAVFSIGTTNRQGWRQRGAVSLRCGEKSSHQKTGLDVGMVKSRSRSGRRFSAVCVQNDVGMIPVLLDRAEGTNRRGMACPTCNASSAVERSGFGVF